MRHGAAKLFLSGSDWFAIWHWMAQKEATNMGYEWRTASDLDAWSCTLLGEHISCFASALV